MQQKTDDFDYDAIDYAFYDIGGSDGRYGTDNQKKELEELPIEIQNKIQELENWANSNSKQAKRNLLWFWILKIPAIVFSATTGILALLEFNILAAILGSISSLCILIDGLFPRGTMRNLQIKAVYEIKWLQNEIVDRWRIGVGDKQTLTREIIFLCMNECKRINSYLISSEMINSDKTVRQAE
ncbi:DUF4231 domain-containing protein [Mangrovibacterium diazotrophicum]|uniref:SMODS and SLOG-associating 2TM effector domain-containing protein n=1 Tax=Mangrovibacterium diazotrophicum TaxID=1261403 RepID=A0A419W316_9BACT|nr:DUF4231 domain-containing protein [Mangrovibacterium diazotrophicum]RKD89853.1 hypothetical protein BC643_0186 [Mangrovibacterium diazotrophicum]